MAPWVARDPGVAAAFAALLDDPATPLGRAAVQAVAAVPPSPARRARLGALLAAGAWGVGDAAYATLTAWAVQEALGLGAAPREA